LFSSWDEDNNKLLGLLTLICVDDGLYFCTSKLVHDKILAVSKRISFGKFSEGPGKFLGNEIVLNLESRTAIVDCDKCAAKLVAYASKVEIPRGIPDGTLLQGAQAAAFRNTIGQMSWLGQPAKPSSLPAVAIFAQANIEPALSDLQ